MPLRRLTGDPQRRGIGVLLRGLCKARATDDDKGKEFLELVPRLIPLSGNEIRRVPAGLALAPAACVEHVLT